MFVALRDLKFAKGRFALMGAVVTLITLLVVLLSGLTAGLGRENVSAITDLDADHLVFAAPAQGQDISFSDSVIPAGTQEAWTGVDGVASVEPIALGMSRVESGERSTGVAFFAVGGSSTLPPAAVRGGEVVLAEQAAEDLGVVAGDTVAVGGTELEVAAVAGRDSYSHAPVAWISTADRPTTGADPTAATVLAIHAGAADLPAADADLGTETVTVADSLNAIGSYSSENGSLQLMRGLLLAISALVIGAFFTVWTVQRSPEIAILKAVGASTGYLLRDAVGQAFVLLLFGTGLGAALAAGLGALASAAVPFVLDPATVLLPAALLVVLGLVGAAASLRRIATVDPLTALGSAR
ncbi:ABC transporter permease [Occultella glacieicola]|uniref:ABC transporter permease n=1 Tax=Occultella glacieicola TaxID=2518684 RepID=A0ABY2EB77_9MICO|nr:ABC transporter permease [Occultella glacieicola]TDE99028.1 ABC transporter permease [Occultella glacieicola]